MKKIAAMAEAYRIQMAPHNPNPPVGAFAILHVDATMPNFAVQECGAGDYATEFNLDLHDGLVPVIRNGYAELPTRPGLGTVLNEKVAEVSLSTDHACHGDGSPRRRCGVVACPGVAAQRVPVATAGPGVAGVAHCAGGGESPVIVKVGSICVSTRPVAPSSMC